MLRLYICCLNEEYKNNSRLSHKILRDILRKDYNIEISENDISYECFGKPYILSLENFHFSISHSFERLCILISDFNVGIDIQYKNKYDMDTLKGVFNKDEIDMIKKNSMTISFYEFWCVKESYIKYFGKSLLKEKSNISIISTKPYLIADRNHIMDNIDFIIESIEEDYIIVICLPKIYFTKCDTKKILIMSQ